MVMCNLERERERLKQNLSSRMFVKGGLKTVITMSSTNAAEIEFSKLNLSNNGNDNDEVFPFLQLPERAQREILNYLSPWVLMDLRLTCKGIKKLVEEDNSFQKLSLQVLNHVQMEEAFKGSATLWKTVIIRSDAQNNDVNWIQNPLYSQLLHKLSASLSSLQLSGHRLPYFGGLCSILSTCNALTRLEIGTLWCGDWNKRAAMDQEKELVLTKPLGKLESLSIGYLAWDKEQDLDAFKYILGQCSSLKFLKVPHILMANFLQNDDEDEEVAEQRYLNLINTALVDPLVAFITESGKRRGTGGDGSNKLDVENMHHTELFPKIVQACFNAGFKLLNVSEAFEDPMKEEEMKYLQVIESLSGCTQYLNFHALTNLKSITLDSETSADSDINENCVKTSKLPCLKSISYCLPEDISPNLLTFLKEYRPSVKTLCIEFQIQESKTTTLLQELFPSVILTQNFSHLQHLTLINWNGLDDDLIGILQSLKLLLSLRLHGCSKITDRGFLGESSEPVLLNLKGLKDLWTDCQITNAVLKDAVRHLPQLESLFYSSELISLPGFLSLTQGPLTENLISLPVIPPENCTNEILQRFLSYFKNLKRKPLSTLFQYQMDGGVL